MEKYNGKTVVATEKPTYNEWRIYINKEVNSIKTKKEWKLKIKYL